MDDLRVLYTQFRQFKVKRNWKSKLFSGSDYSREVKRQSIRNAYARIQVFFNCVLQTLRNCDFEWQSNNALYAKQNVCTPIEAFRQRAKQPFRLSDKAWTKKNSETNLCIVWHAKTLFMRETLHHLKAEKTSNHSKMLFSFHLHIHKVFW